MTQLTGSKQRRASPGHHRSNHLPRLGFLGVGWIGRHRMQALLEGDAAEAFVIADPCPDACSTAAQLAPDAVIAGSLEDLLEHDLDGLVIATPSALHAEQAGAALRRGLPVFCQKPLARTRAESRAIVDAARRSDCLLGLDLSYRHTSAYRAVAKLIRSGSLGDLFSLDLTFHNAYGPDKPWFRDPTLAGGGCMIDLGIHLIDLALLSLEWPEVEVVASDLYARGALVTSQESGVRGQESGVRSQESGVRGQESEVRNNSTQNRADGYLDTPCRKAPTVEDYATAQLRTDGGQSIRIACSWNLHAGQNAVIEMAFHGTRGAAAIRNVNGSFYDFVAEHFQGTSRTLLSEPPDTWGGRAAIAWAQQVRSGHGFDPGAERFVQVSHIMDRIYGR